ncbi:hypothetical protein [Sphingomonas sp. PB1R3]|uniref:hypothetical protein n=1 Tax=Sphingomonas flavida TaxID=3096154 RepID=UPI002FC6E345
MMISMNPILSIALFAVSASNVGQERDPEQEQAPLVSVQSTPVQTRQGETPPLAAGQTGLRQSREQVAADTGIMPMGRIDARIQNRVQMRIRNRIDRYYDPTANTTSPFAVAAEQANQAGRSAR